MVRLATAGRLGGGSVLKILIPRAVGLEGRITIIWAVIVKRAVLVDRAEQTQGAIAATEPEGSVGAGRACRKSEVTQTPPNRREVSVSSLPSLVEGGP